MNPFVTTHELTPEQAAEVFPLSTTIARAARSVPRLVEQFHARPVLMTDLAESVWNRSNYWANHLAAIPFGQVVEAREALTRLTELLGEDASVLDHAWGAGLEQFPLAAMEVEVAGLEEMMVPLRKLRVVLGLVHKSVQAA